MTIRFKNKRSILPGYKWNERVCPIGIKSFEGTDASDSNWEKKSSDALMPCHASTNAPCLSFSLSAVLRLQLHRKTMRLQSYIAERKKYCAILRHLTRDMTLKCYVDKTYWCAFCRTIKS